MHLIKLFTHFLIARSGLMSLLFSLFALVLLPLFVVAIKGYEYVLLLRGVYASALESASQLFEMLSNRGTANLVRDIPDLIFLAVARFDGDLLLILFALIIASFIFGVIAFVSKKSRGKALTGIGVSIAISAVYFSLYTPQSYYASLVEKKKALIEQIAKLEDKEQQGDLGSNYNMEARLLGATYSPDSIFSNRNKAIKFYLKAARNGDRTAQIMLGTMYATGPFPNKDKAREWFIKAIDNEDKRDLAPGQVSEIEYVKKIIRKYNVEKFVPEASIILFEETLSLEAIWGDEFNRCDIARHYKEGAGVEQNYELAYLWISRSNYRLAEDQRKLSRADECNALREQIKSMLSPEKMNALNKKRGLFYSDWRRKRVSEQMMASMRFKAKKVLADKLRKVKGAGEPEDMYDLAVMYKRGIGGIKSNNKEACFWTVVAIASYETGQHGLNIRTYSRYKKLQSEIADCIPLDAEGRDQKKEIAYLEQKYPNFYKDGKRSKEVNAFVKQLEHLKENPPPTREEIDLATRKLINSKIVIAEEGAYPVKLFSQAVDPQRVRWVDNEKILYIDRLYTSHKMRSSEIVYGLVLFNTITGETRELTSLTNRGTYVFDTLEKQVYYYQEHGKEKIFKRAVLKGMELIELETTAETSKQFYKLISKRKVQKTKYDGKLERCIYFPDVNENSTKFDASIYQRGLCHTIGEIKTMIFKQDFFNSALSPDGCRVFGTTNKSQNIERMKGRFIINLCKKESEVEAKNERP